MLTLATKHNSIKMKIFRTFSPLALVLLLVSCMLVSSKANSVHKLTLGTNAIQGGGEATKTVIDEIISFQHDIDGSERNSLTEKPSGRRQHGPFVITKVIDKSTPLLLQAFLTSTRFATWKLEGSYSSSLSPGEEQHFYTIELIDAIVCKRGHAFLDEFGQGRGRRARADREEIAFCYEDIIWTFEGGIVAEDSRTN